MTDSSQPIDPEVELMFSTLDSIFMNPAITDEMRADAQDIGAVICEDCAVAYHYQPEFPETGGHTCQSARQSF